MLLSLTFLFEVTVKLMILHLLHRATKDASCASKLTSHQSPITAILEVVLEYTSLAVLFTGIRVRTYHRQFIKKSEENIASWMSNDFVWYFVSPLKNQIWRGASHLIQRLTTNGTRCINPQIGWNAGLKLFSLRWELFSEVFCLKSKQFIFGKS